MIKKIMPSTYFYLGVGLIILVHFVFPISRIIYYPYILIGIFPILFGVIADTLARSLFIKNKTTQKHSKMPDKFITKGIYKISRNPMYLGMLSILLGESILLGDLITFIFPLAFFIIINLFFIPPEEKNMEKKFSKRYLQYKNKVRRWI